MSNWQVEDIDDNLAADFDGSLSGLGVDLSTASYNMSEALLALPSLTVFKQEAPSPSSQADNGLSQNSPPSVTADGTDCSPPTLHHLLQQGGPNFPQGSATLQHQDVQRFHKLNDTGSSDQSRFQYVLAAATSIATKVNEETLTYLNQGQSYEIKLKKLGDLTTYRGKILRSVIRLLFHERRLQYMEREQMAAWRQSRPGDRILEVDIPLSYGVYDVVQDAQQLNAVEFLWDPTKEVGVYVKVNCISTEFTPKKHGGEKGVPFRIQVETYTHGEGPAKRLHAAACQIKVFKLKGADRKHKQDREKILKRPLSEQEKFQPSYDCTVLTDVPLESVYPPGPSNAVTSTGTSGVNGAFSPQDSHSRGATTPTKDDSPSATDQELPESPPYYLQVLPPDANAQQTSTWLQAHRFSSYVHTFSTFSGADILRLSRDDLIQICGLADGIRLFNALHTKSIAPRLTIYISLEQGQVFHALYLENLSCMELAAKLAQLVSLPPQNIHDVFVQGPGGIHVLITDEVVRNIKDESMFAVEVLHMDQTGERFRLLMKSTSP